MSGKIQQRQITALALILLLLLLVPKTANDCKPDPIQLIDHGNRAVTLPNEIEKVYATTEAGLFLIYALNPDSILGWNRGLSPELEFAILPEYHGLPTVGSWDLNYKTACPEALRGLKPDLIVHYAAPDEPNKRLAAEISETLEVPTVLIDNSLRALPEALHLLGKLLSREVRGQALATFTENRLRQASSFQSAQTYYNPIPVHIVSPSAPGYFDELLQFTGMVEIPHWSDKPPFPDFVLIMPHQIMDPYRAIEEDGHKRIYQIPSFPLSWLDPGSIFALLGIEWLHTIAYPNTYPANLAETYSTFMEVFFQINVTPELLAWTLRRSGISY